MCVFEYVENNGALDLGDFMIIQYLFTLYLTVVAEEAVAFLFLRDKYFLLLVVVVNCITHMIFNYILFILLNIFLIKITFFSLIIFELAIVVIEACLYNFVGFSKIKMILYSFSANTVSLFLGLCLIKIGILPGAWIF